MLNEGDQLLRYVVATVAYDMRAKEWDQHPGTKNLEFDKFMADQDKAKMLVQAMSSLEPICHPRAKTCTVQYGRRY